MFALGARALVPGTNTKWCCVQTLGTQDIVMLPMPEYKVETCTMPEFWRGYLK